jgi:hypothetical protein
LYAYFYLYFHVPQKYKYLATDADGRVHAFTQSPVLDEGCFMQLPGSESLLIAEVEFTGAILWFKTCRKIEWC